MNELRDLKEKNRQLQQQVSENEKAVSDDNAGTRTNSNVWPNLSIPAQPRQVCEGKVSDEVKIPINTLQLLIRRLTRNMYCKVHRPVNTPEYRITRENVRSWWNISARSHRMCVLTMIIFFTTKRLVTPRTVMHHIDNTTEP
ncbi:mobilisation protein A [Bacteroides eggerthii]|uniref:Mobilisation protein A n=1 Tax=Bacteroides eggerthii TaxID=28111 RepID=A0A380ZB49_9BACE|nr:mobilisation protein A [Bacteroides eggerthii]